LTSRRLGPRCTTLNPSGGFSVVAGRIKMLKNFLKGVKDFFESVFVGAIFVVGSILAIFIGIGLGLYLLYILFIK